MAKKKEEKILFKKSIAIYVVIEIILIIALINVGFIGNLFHSAFSFFFGLFTPIFILCFIFIFIILIFDKLSFIFKHPIFYAVLLFIFNIYFIYSIIYFVNNSSVLQVKMLALEHINSTPGNFSLWLNKIGFMLFDSIGSIIISIVIFIIIGYLINSEFSFVQSLYEKGKDYKLKEQDRKYQEALQNKNSNTVDLEHTDTLIDSKTNSDLFKSNPFETEKEKPLHSVKPNETMVLEMVDELFPPSKNEKQSSTVNKNTNNNTSNDDGVKVRGKRTIQKSSSLPKTIGRYKLPNIDNLQDYENGSEVYDSLMSTAKHNAEILVNTLKSFKLNVKILDIVIGPSVTRFELQPEIGVKVNKFNSLSNDIALSLASSDVRIEAPIPGKSAIGIEVPNQQTMMVSLKEVFTSTQNDFNNKLQVALGKDINGDAQFLDIAKTPHMLVAGATGSGKSVCINTIITSILFKSSPDDVKMVMIDPKKVELTPYNNIPHLLSPVVTDPKKASVALQKLVAEMEYRYELFTQTNTRNIEGYNQKAGKDNTFMKLPYIVIIVDELADLMMVASNEVETSIARIAQMARAAGMHLILATQRPSTDVITGLIKSNIPTRIAFSVSSGIDSRTILDKTGAEKLLGRGDMLLSTATSPNLYRIQGAFLTDNEIMDIVDEVTSQFSSEDISNFHSEELSDEALENDIEIGELDEFYEEVKADVIQNQKASAASIQRKYRVGYNRACDILDQLEKNNIISANEGTKPRRVLVSHEDIEER